MDALSTVTDTGNSVVLSSERAALHPFGSDPSRDVSRRLRRALYFYAAFLVLFGLAVGGLWFWGPNLFAILLKQARAYTPPQFLTWLSLASSLSVACAFCVMPFSLFRVVRKRSDVPFGGIVLCFAAFLFLCGLSAFLGLANIWFHGPVVIWLLVLAQLGTALLSVGTVLILRALVPGILQIPTREQWLSLNHELLRAEADTAAKDKLLAMVSHELRTPLAPLLGTLTELERHVAPTPDPAVRECIEVLRRNVMREARIVTELLDKLELPSTDPNSSPVAIKYAAPRRLLLVEDHDDTLRIFARILRQRGFDVQEASSVAEAVAASRAGDLLLSDIALPDGDGRDLMRRLGPRGIPGIAISGFGTAKDREEYKKAGFAESLVKPVDIDDLVRAIERVTAAATEMS